RGWCSQNAGVPQTAQSPARPRGWLLQAGRGAGGVSGTGGSKERAASYEVPAPGEILERFRSLAPFSHLKRDKTVAQQVRQMPSQLMDEMKGPNGCLAFVGGDWSDISRWRVKDCREGRSVPLGTAQSPPAQLLGRGLERHAPTGVIAALQILG